MQAQANYDEAVARRNSIRGQLSGVLATLDVNSPTSFIDNEQSGGSATSLSGLLVAARAKLADLRTRYTEQYPDVIAQKNMVARLQAEIASSPRAGGGSSMQGIANPAYTALRSKLADEEALVAVARERLSSAQRRVQLTKGGAVDALSIQRQYQDLNRDYTVLQENYQQLVTRRESANISQAAGSQQSATFRVIDPPLQPDRPIAPNRAMYNMLVLLLGIACGGALALAICMLQDRFQSAESLTEAFSIPMIGMVTACESPIELANRRRTTMIFAGGVSALVLCYFIVVLAFNTPLAASQGAIL